uniref:Metalloendopeptidase n=1 Tax=Electrophorus electricus TaxID=8005 RepID=A0A4W4GKI3_ELEEL
MHTNGAAGCLVPPQVTTGCDVCVQGDCGSVGPVVSRLCQSQGGGERDRCKNTRTHKLILDIYQFCSELVCNFDEPELIDDIAVDPKRNADPCTSQGCMWPKSSDGKVHVPYVIANHFSSRELQVIQRGLVSFSSVACIHFRRRSNERDYISIESCNGCYSFVGRRGYAQTVSLDRNGCIYHHTVQHELLHALGFNHEQTRSDRDNHILVVWENIIDNMKHNFNKIATLNQETPYDYNSVMQYHKTAFSKNGLPTMVPIPNSNVAFGQCNHW